MPRPNLFIRCRIKTKVKPRIMKKWIKRFIKYYRNPKNEFGFFVSGMLMRKWSTLPANIYLDDSGMWMYIGNKKFILVQINNKYERDFNKIIPMTIEDKPQFLFNKEKIDLTDQELGQIKDFIRNCKDDLVQYAEETDHIKFYDIFKSKGYIKNKEQEL